MKKFFLLFLIPFSLNALEIVCAENFYGDIARQIGGSYITVTSLLSNPNQDPHLFSTTPRMAKAVADADIIVYNGIGYDVWMEHLIAALKAKKTVINVSQLIGKKQGDNPHIWYDPQTMPILAEKLASLLSQMDPGHLKQFQKNLDAFNESYQSLLDQIEQMRDEHEGTPVIATEPVFNYMADSLGLTMYGLAFQLSVMNDTEPSINAVKEFEDVLRSKAKVLIYNRQTTNGITKRMESLAVKDKVPIMGITETLPAGQDYQSWMSGQLAELEKKLP